MVFLSHDSFTHSALLSNTSHDSLLPFPPLHSSHPSLNHRRPSPSLIIIMRNGDTPSPIPHFHSLHKLRRFNSLILIFRLAAFCFSLASSIFMFTNSRGANSPRWYDFDAFRFVLAANAIIAIYSLFEIGVSSWEISSGATFFPEILQVWFDFGHDQVFAYLLLSAESAGTELARTLKENDTCTASNAFCVQSDISVALGFAGFIFIAVSSLLSGFRVACFIINGSRFHF